jgi:hypothetical protein
MSRSRLKATRRPSADQAGSLSLDAPVVSRLSPVPSAFTTQMSSPRSKAITPFVPGKAANAGEAGPAIRPTRRANGRSKGA